MNAPESDVSPKPYEPKHLSQSEYLTIRGKRYHVRRWGNPDAPLLFLMHGWMDFSATYQFIVDALEREWNIMAPDWSGYGGSEGREGAYYLTEYIADLDALIDHYSPGVPANIVAHSMGGSMSMFYAGVRPERVSHVVNMEGLGPMPSMLKTADVMMAEWLDLQREPKEGATYRSVADFAKRLVRGNQRLSLPRALFLAEQFTVPREDGRFDVLAESSVRSVLPLYLHNEQTLQIWSKVTAKLLFLRGDDSFFSQGDEASEAEIQERINTIAQHQVINFQNAAHNMQHDVPELIAQAIEQFLP